jgi:hypothetical protein
MLASTKVIKNIVIMLLNALPVQKAGRHYFEEKINQRRQIMVFKQMPDVITGRLPT